MRELTRKDEQELAVCLLARIDACHSPRRYQGHNATGRAFQTVEEHRLAYAKAGYPWASRLASGSTEAARKSTQRLLEVLGEAGYVKVNSPRNARVANVRITPAGDTRLRHLLGLPIFEDEGVSLLDYMVGHNEDPDTIPCDDGVSLFREDALVCDFDSPDWKKHFEFFHNTFLTCAVRGLLEWNSDTAGLLYYRLTDVGVVFAMARAEGKKTPMPRLPKVRPSAGLFELYCETWTQQYRAFDTLAPKDRNELGLCPLPLDMETRAELAAEADQDTCGKVTTSDSDL